MIKCVSFLILSGLVVSMPLMALEKDMTSKETTKISLEEAKRYAIDNNYGVQSLIQQVEAKKSQKNKTKSVFYPSVGLVGGTEQNITKELSEATPIGYVYGRINLFNGFGDVYNSEIAQINTEKSWVALEYEKFQVALDVEQQFHKFLYYRDLIDIMKDALHQNASHQSLVKKSQSRGMSSNTDVMEFKLKDSSLKSELVSLKQGLESARINLRRLLGEDVGRVIEPVGNLQHQHVEGELMGYLDKIKEHSVPVKLATKEQALESINAKKWRSQWMPSIDLEAQAGYLPSDSLPSTNEVAETSIAILLTAKLELFSGMATYWQKKEQEYQRNSSASELKNQILLSITQMEESYRELKSIEERVDLEIGNEEMSRLYYKAVLEEYKRGFKNSADLSSASDGLYATKRRQLDYKFAFLKQRITFEKSYGAPIKITVIDEIKL